MTESALLLEPAAPPHPHPQPQRILVVDDDHDLVQLLVHHLCAQGFQAASAHSGRDALVKAEDWRPHAVLLDLKLPDMHGYEVCQILTDDPQFCGLPILIVSAADEDNIVRRSRAAGGRFFVRKPYDPNALLVLLEQALSEAG